MFRSLLVDVRFSNDKNLTQSHLAGLLLEMALIAGRVL